MQAGTSDRRASCGCCFIIPPDILKQLANDPKNADQQTVLDNFRQAGAATGNRPLGEAFDRTLSTAALAEPKPVG